MNWIKNNVIVPLKNQIIAYNPIRDVCQFFGDSCLVLSPNMYQMTNAGNISFGRKIRYYGTFVIHLVVTIKYAILAIYNDPYTIAMSGESFHVLTNIHFMSGFGFSMQMILLSNRLYTWYMGERYIVDMFVTISQLDTSLPFNRINNRKLTTRMWLMSKLSTKSLPFTWIVFTALILYCLTWVYLYSSVPVNLVNLIVNSSIQCIWLCNLVVQTRAGGFLFFYVMSMTKLRYRELIHLVKVHKLDGVMYVNYLYNQLVGDIKIVRRYFDPLIGILYLTCPFAIAFAFQLVLDGNWLGKVLGLVSGFIGFSTNYLIYYMASSICLMNDIIANLLYPIQFDKRFKSRRMKLKIDSLIARLNEEFVGFDCLYAIKFNRMSFYQYILGLTSTYLLVNGLVNSRQE